ncbi:ribonuclease P 40kDa subunit-domain-containing protein [Cubamyces lactineus]|nr:ribonuclease P 40kDa subunit-domain-containing protein [Cubamyces lactineus]
MPALEDKRTFVSTGTYQPDTATDSDRPLAAARSRPFTRQVDVVFPSCPALEEALLHLSASYWTCQCSLGAFLEHAKPWIHERQLSSKVVALGLSGNDVWSIDHRGYLTLCLKKEIYEEVGYVGQPLPWKEYEDTFVIRTTVRVALAKPATNESQAAQAIRRLDSITRTWKVCYYFINETSQTPSQTPSGHMYHSLTPFAQKLENAYIPEVRHEVTTTRSRLEPNDSDDRGEEVATLFEWVGMASFLSPRLLTQDRCDPYIAVYTPPEPHRVGDVTTIRWRGIIPTEVLQRILSTIRSSHLPPPNFVAVTGHTIGNAPAAYFLENKTVAPLRVPRDDAEDTWSMIHVNEPNMSPWWVLAESVGQWDKRWG